MCFEFFAQYGNLSLTKFVILLYPVFKDSIDSPR